MENSPVKRGQMPPGGATTFDLFSWSEGPDLSQDQAAAPRSPSYYERNAATENGSPVGRPTIRMHQPAGGVSTLKFGDQITAEEAEALLKRRPGSDTKRREMFGSGILTDGTDSANGVPERTGVRMHQPAGGVSQINFAVEECASPKKLTAIHEVAKQKELSGTSETYADIQQGRSRSSFKAKELVGSNIFGPPPVLPPRSLNRNLEAREEPKEVKPAEAAPRNVRTSVKVSNPAGGRSQILFGSETSEVAARKVHDQKMAELSGNNIFKGDPPASAEKPVSVAKLREMSGSDIFADDKPAPRDCVGGIRKPPGGESSIALV
ncbi:hypothetical protein SELMODRAFT_271239 [Selaginella moellendorffii]|uniref:DUF4057 domain-containing protein n=1 Tax=Selaginella moellendorffii TaxID=88036 RepID=D8S1L0_SELML|nr:uncharacterized protein LOC9638998 [Selaginella moellendorffii]EFJ21872.1 hypothetical protein SELMODRAFT_271239 [Selaginella moellendorffii]|eukprot:XP_002977263.1 uncharacterized protein LOC9638998 [Selaginella moellendorffii]